MDNANKIRRLTAIGEALHGERWQRPLGRDLDVSPALMSSIATGTRRVTPDVEERLMRTILDEIVPDLQATISMLRTHAADIAAELGLELEPAMVPELGGPS